MLSLKDIMANGPWLNQIVRESLGTDLFFFFLRGRLAGEKEAAHACRKEGLDYSILDYLIVVFCLNDVIYIYI